MVALVDLYVDLVELGLRSLETNENGITVVPTFLKDKVKTELERRTKIQ